MPRYFLHIREHGTLIVDPEGDEVPDLDEARRLALETIRDILSRPDTYGAADLWRARSLEITDETGTVLLTLPFTNV